ncbi:tRNA (adenosine(37)-N6)-threonylcarbamoyltransferase complex dimerization subunit type 1 TsaB [Gloeobacter morelensis]|uniref:tRNA (Adenosine(37)-N6)-threonylcarbamoyltransferase complex dimerization subunit type 1 TsaB n=1 Tax=Gloeobacter morelensis MG652769 TaxID=2781736 RepID=A0ABY3PJY2_9CYAN|nr:tRNA (adenosine(37)-N6)-threonylcarbamoyltransferase complex dimerization subunit type 1 TsaB [Gloeobacter morelensis]UFP93980.1 tRNA (adenosine(37)-N6)-threonylcarbamoyltransferase complex dimerization subunit type 1 TsaB [Gloeobacter morelensis MG652769]
MSGTAGLGLHTSTDTLGLALWEGESLRTQLFAEGRALSETLQVRLRDFLVPRRFSDLDWIAICIGPGSFTATRLGVVTARTLAQALAVPLLGVNALEALAAAHPGHGPVAVWLDARRGDRYAALYERVDGVLITLRDVALVLEAHWEAWQGTLPPGCRVIAGDAVPEPPIAALMHLAHGRFEGGLRPGWFEVEPLYGRGAPIHPGAVAPGPD